MLIWLSSLEMSPSWSPRSPTTPDDAITFGIWASTCALMRAMQTFRLALLDCFHISSSNTGLELSKSEFMPRLCMFTLKTFLSVFFKNKKQRHFWWDIWSNDTHWAHSELPGTLGHWRIYMEAFYSLKKKGWIYSCGKWENYVNFILFFLVLFWRKGRHYSTHGGDQRMDYSKRFSPSTW